MSKLFISHSSKDLPIVEKFVEFLQMGMGLGRDEIYCTSLKGTLPIGENFIEHIKENVIGCNAVIFLITESYLKSPFCMAELGAAWALNHTIFPLLVEPITYEAINNTPISGKQCLHLFNKNDLGQLANEFSKKKIRSFNFSNYTKYSERFLSHNDDCSPNPQNDTVLTKDYHYNRYIEDLTEKSKTEDEARFLLGTIYWEGILVKQDRLKATELLMLAATNNYAPAQFKLSSMYYKGDTGEQSFEKAFLWEKKAAIEEGYSWALDGLGYLYRVGLGCKQDIKASLQCYTKAVELGCNNSLIEIGEIYKLMHDYENAIKWYSKAVDSGYKYAALRLGILYKDGGKNDLSPDYTQASYYLHIAAQAGITEAKYHLGLLYYWGHGVFKKDYAEAVKWFREAAEEGEMNSQYNLGYAYHHGIGVEYNWQEAVDWYEKAAQRGHQLAQIDLADLLAQYDRQQYVRAIYWYTKAADQNSCEAHRKLGDIYSFGVGCKVDQLEAIRHYKSAAEQGDTISEMRLKQLQ